MDNSLAKMAKLKRVTESVDDIEMHGREGTANEAKGFAGQPAAAAGHDPQQILDRHVKEMVFTSQLDGGFSKSDLGALVEADEANHFGRDSPEDERAHAEKLGKIEGVQELSN